MKFLNEKKPYFFQHKNHHGFVLALQKGMYGHYIVIHNNKHVEYLRLDMCGENESEVQRIYRILYRWLDYKTPKDDVIKKSKKIENNHYYAKNSSYMLRDQHVVQFTMLIERLPQTESEIQIPDLYGRSQKEFLDKMKVTK